MLGQDDAQGMIDAFSAAALAAGAATRLRRGSYAPTDLRLIFVFGGLGLFFAFRGTAILLGNPALRVLAQLMVAPLMLAGLVLAEGVLRRHAPRWLKAAVTACGVLVCAMLLALGGGTAVTLPAWAAYVTLSLATITLLVWRRDRASLSHQENASVEALLWALGALTLLAVTDFLPAFPVMMSGIGASLLVLLARHNPTSRRGVRQGLAEVGVILAAAALFTVLLARALAWPGWTGAIRLGVVTTALLIALSMLQAALRGGGRDEARALRRALAAADLSSLPAFLDGLADQALLRGLVLAEGAVLADYDQGALRRILQARPVWRRQEAAGRAAAGTTPSADQDAGAAYVGTDELDDLMARTEASHAALVSADPVRVALLTLPDLAPAAEAETDLALFCKLAAVAAKRCP